MQETRLKKSQKTDILSTLKAFSVGDVENIPFSESQVDTSYWRTRLVFLRKSGLLPEGSRYKIIASDNPVGTIIMRLQ